MGDMDWKDCGAKVTVLREAPEGCTLEEVRRMQEEYSCGSFDQDSDLWFSVDFDGLADPRRLVLWLPAGPGMPARKAAAEGFVRLVRGRWGRPEVLQPVGRLRWLPSEGATRLAADSPFAVEVFYDESGRGWARFAAPGTDWDGRAIPLGQMHEELLRVIAAGAKGE